MVLDNRAGGRLFSYVMRALSGSSLQQKRSFLEGKVGAAFGSSKLSDRRGSARDQGPGLEALRQRGHRRAAPPALCRVGALRNYYIDTYYGKKLSMPPTTAGMSNLTWRLGDKPQEGATAISRRGSW